MRPFRINLYSLDQGDATPETAGIDDAITTICSKMDSYTQDTCNEYIDIERLPRLAR